MSVLSVDRRTQQSGLNMHRNIHYIEVIELYITMINIYYYTIVNNIKALVFCTGERDFHFDQRLRLILENEFYYAR